MDHGKQVCDGTRSGLMKFSPLYKLSRTNRVQLQLYVIQLIMRVLHDSDSKFSRYGGLGAIGHRI